MAWGTWRRVDLAVGLGGFQLHHWQCRVTGQGNGVMAFESVGRQASEFSLSGGLYATDLWSISWAWFCWWAAYHSSWVDQHEGHAWIYMSGWLNQSPAQPLCPCLSTMFHNVTVLQGPATCKCGQFLRPTAGGVVLSLFVLAHPLFRHNFLIILLRAGHSPGRLGLGDSLKFTYILGWHMPLQTV